MAEHTNSSDIVVWVIWRNRDPIPLRAARITKKSVYLKQNPLFPKRLFNSPAMYSLHSDTFDFYLSWEEAHNGMQRRAQDRVDALRRQLEQAKGDLGRIKGMKPPGEAKQ